MVRDLDKLRTRSEFRLRSGHLALIVAGTALGAGLLFAVGNAIAGQTPAASQPAAKDRDPFAGLETNGEAQARPAAAPPVRAAGIEPLRLPSQQGRPVATPPPTGAEAPLPVEPDPVVGATASAPLPALPTEWPVAAPPAPAVLAPAAPLPAGPPAAPPGVAIAPVPTQSAREAVAPPLPVVTDAQPIFDEEPTPPLAEPGTEGIFTLQVSSFEDQGEAIAFMNMLRQRGHESFLVRADCGERGLIYRVRVGPFHSQAEAERYRRKFERTERIPTFVVRRQLP